MGEPRNRQVVLLMRRVLSDHFKQWSRSKICWAVISLLALGPGDWWGRDCLRSLGSFVSQNKEHNWLSTSLPPPKPIGRICTKRGSYTWVYQLPKPILNKNKIQQGNGLARDVWILACSCYLECWIWIEEIKSTKTSSFRTLDLHWSGIEDVGWIIRTEILPKASDPRPLEDVGSLFFSFIFFKGIIKTFLRGFSSLSFAWKVHHRWGSVVLVACHDRYHCSPKRKLVQVNHYTNCDPMFIIFSDSYLFHFQKFQALYILRVNFWLARKLTYMHAPID